MWLIGTFPFTNFCCSGIWCATSRRTQPPAVEEMGISAHAYAPGMAVRCLVWVGARRPSHPALCGGFKRMISVFRRYAIWARSAEDSNFLRLINRARPRDRIAETSGWSYGGGPDSGDDAGPIGRRGLFGEIRRGRRLSIPTHHHPAINWVVLTCFLEQMLRAKVAKLHQKRYVAPTPSREAVATFVWPRWFLLTALVFDRDRSDLRGNAAPRGGALKMKAAF